MLRRAAVVVVLAAALAVPAAADTPTLQGNVGPGFTISLKDTSHLSPGAYAIHVVDQADIHSFHLAGPGVDERTKIETTGTADWQVTLQAGTYRFFCDAHPTTMKGSFAVGAQPTTSKPKPKAKAKPKQKTKPKKK